MSNTRPLDGRTALVTGSAAGLGNAMARRLAEAGAAVMLSGLEDRPAAADMCEEIAAQHGVRVDYHRADLTSTAQIEGLIARSEELFGQVDILVNNAVVRHFAPIEQFPLAEWERALAVNLTAAFLATKLVLPKMRAADYGRIFNMTSVYGSRATMNRVDYVTTKTGIQGLTRATAIETAGSNVSCHALTPGSVLTPASEIRIAQMMEKEGICREEAEQRFLDGKQPSGRFVEVDSVADVLLMLCGPVGRDMNGAILPIEGGWLARG